MSELSSNEKLQIMNDTKQLILDYLVEQAEINATALKSYENDTLDKYDPEIKKMRETEAIKLRDRIYELNRHIAVIKRM
ncbi:hypothetical protein BWD42_04115 [Sphingobacterium sp. CZ-UAM]|uniref:hypothetical protein n=1 Tax=Sphingobacterium sp. CZ-UAM TaxID=1933868 RepID=UPI0009875310|nr:hypothetical protein [Sphingobacterium sp. CZ-UAM]OOG19143.1 hypothetical protein BWD42_04115 [Sphingobacterium sp. CZ-UAM]